MDLLDVMEIKGNFLLGKICYLFGRRWVNYCWYGKIEMYIYLIGLLFFLDVKDIVVKDRIRS